MSDPDLEWKSVRGLSGVNCVRHPQWKSSGGLSGVNHPQWKSGCDLSQPQWKSEPKWKSDRSLSGVSHPQWTSAHGLNTEWKLSKSDLDWKIIKSDPEWRLNKPDPDWKSVRGVSSSSTCSCSFPHGQDMYSERGSVLSALTSHHGRVILVGCSLVIIQSVGLILSLCFLVQNYLSQEEDDPYKHLCTTAALCLLYKYGEFGDVNMTNIALSAQILAALIAIGLNLSLVWGVLYRRAWALIPWLVGYLVAIICCLGLGGVVVDTVIDKHWESEDTDLAYLGLALVPTLLGLVYAIIWTLVAIEFRNLRQGNRIFSLNA